MSGAITSSLTLCYWLSEHPEAFSKGNDTKDYMLDPFPEKILKQKWRKISNPFLYRRAKKVFAEQQRIRKFFTEKSYEYFDLKGDEWQDKWNSRSEHIAEWARCYIDGLIED